jgi:hypothetical protein
LVGQRQQGGVKKSISAKRAPEKVTVTISAEAFERRYGIFSTIRGNTE